MPYLFILCTIMLTVYGQIVIKWRVSVIGAMPDEQVERIKFLVGFVLNPWIISSYIGAFIASLFWIAAVRQLPLSYAYPFTSLSFVAVIILSAVLFRESVTFPKLLGIILIILGIAVGSRG